MGRPYRDHIGDRRRGRAPHRSETERSPDQERKDDVLGQSRGRRPRERDGVGGNERAQHEDPFGHGEAAPRNRAAARPHEDEWREDEPAERVPEPPQPPQSPEAAGRLHTAHAEKSDSDRRGDDRGDRERAEESEYVARASERTVEAGSPEDRDADDGFERVSDGDAGGHPERFAERQVRREGADQDAGDGSPAEEPHGGESETGRRPHRGDLSSFDRQR